MKGYLYILKCANGKYYTGSTTDLERRLAQHQAGEGANFTRKHLPVELVFAQEFDRIDEAFYREKQVQGWSRKKKEALINGEFGKLPGLAECKNETHHRNAPLDSARGTPSMNTGTPGTDTSPPPRDTGTPTMETSTARTDVERSRNGSENND